MPHNYLTIRKICESLNIINNYEKYELTYSTGFFSLLADKAYIINEAPLTEKNIIIAYNFLLNEIYNYIMSNDKFFTDN